MRGEFLHGGAGATESDPYLAGEADQTASLGQASDSGGDAGVRTLSISELFESPASGTVDPIDGRRPHSQVGIGQGCPR